MGARVQSQSVIPPWVGRYEIVRPIARGGMAEVYLARTRPMVGVERLFAIKCCHPHLRDDHEFAAMFIEEARLAAQIRHPNVVATFDVGDEEMLYLVMEYVEGQPLSELIKAARSRGEHIPVPIVLRIVADALTGLHAAHETRDAEGRPLGVVHRDVSPQNILVGIDGTARIVDFGIAKAEASATVTREGQVKGKLAYLPPEQLTDHVMTRRGDVYAIGVVLWETLACRRLFSGQNAGEIAMKVLEKAVEPPSLHATAGAVPPALDQAVLKALQRDPERRFATAADLAAALETCGVALASPRSVGEWVSVVHAARTEQPTVYDRSAPTPPTTPVLTRRPTQPDGRPVTVRARPVIVAAALAVVLAGTTAVTSAIWKYSSAPGPAVTSVGSPAPAARGGGVPRPGGTKPDQTSSLARAGAAAPEAKVPVLAAQPAGLPVAEVAAPPPALATVRNRHRAGASKVNTPMGRNRDRIRRTRATPSSSPDAPAAPPPSSPSEFRPGGV